MYVSSLCPASSSLSKLTTYLQDEFISEATVTDEPGEDVDPTHASAFDLSPFPSETALPVVDEPTPLQLIGLSFLKPVNSMSLSEFCSLVSSHASLQHADIPTTEAYTEPIGPILHRFLLLELRPAVGTPIWLRLDRRTGKTKLQIVLSRGTVPAHDTVSYSSPQVVSTSQRLTSRL